MNTILFLGTGAADWPEDVPVDKTPETGDRNFRRRSAVLVNDRLLIDCGRSVPGALETFSADPDLIEDILITHSHSDHFDIDSLSRLACNASTGCPIRLWAHPSVLERVPEISGLTLCPLTVGQSLEAVGFTITALTANHVVEDSDEIALHFLFRSAMTTFFYATDGAWLLKDTWLALQAETLDAIIWDATIGEVKGDYRIFEHNSLDMIRLMKASLLEQQVLTSASKIVLTHLAMTLHSSHEEVTQAVLAEGLTVAYDGLRLVIG